jgi:hypothetical protein
MVRYNINNNCNSYSQCTETLSRCAKASLAIDKDLINIIGPALYAHSFPSGHTVTIFTFAGLLIYRYRSVFFRIAIIILAILVGISRIAVGAHWPTDVIAGAAIGILCSMAGVFIVTMPGWKSNRNGQVILGGLLILTNMYLLLIYNCGYGQAIYFQRFFALTVLVAGSREYYLLPEPGTLHHAPQSQSQPQPQPQPQPQLRHLYQNRLYSVSNVFFLIYAPFKHFKDLVIFYQFFWIFFFFK